MSYIRIPVPLVVAVLLAAVLAAVGAQLPELQRYLKVKAM
jgi:Family of unknown function (DUF6893)